MSVHGFEAMRERVGEGTFVVDVVGELDLYTAPELARALAGVDEDSTLVVDLTRCTFIDSTALGILVALNDRLGYPGARLSIVATDALVRPFELTGLAGLFAFFPDRRAALGGGPVG